MRLRATLLQLAVLASAGCSASTPASVLDAGDSSSGGGGGSSGGGSGSSSGNTSCPVPNSHGSASPAQACQIAQTPVPGEGPGNYVFQGAVCEDFCVALNDGGGNYGYTCGLPANYVSAYDGADGGGSDAGSADGGSDGGACPTWSGDVAVLCVSRCVGGRSTAGVAEPEGCAAPSTGSLLAARAFLEAVSVHAFARLERELSAHGAPHSLLRDSRRARRDELRHTAMMARLARRYRVVPRAPEPPAPSPVRSLFAIALENALEGCVRETYGAVVNLVEARASRDPAVRKAMRSLAADECRHAELAWAVAAWLRPRLTPEERDAVARATREGVTALAGDGDARIVGLLAARVWQAA